MWFPVFYFTSATLFTQAAITMKHITVSTLPHADYSSHIQDIHRHREEPMDCLMPFFDEFRAFHLRGIISTLLCVTTSPLSFAEEDPHHSRVIDSCHRVQSAPGVSLRLMENQRSYQHRVFTGVRYVHSTVQYPERNGRPSFRKRWLGLPHCHIFGETSVSRPRACSWSVRPFQMPGRISW